MKKKVFIIGSGFSSLSAACYLSKSGYDVHVFEKNNSLGGRAAQFKANGFTFDMGPSWYWMPDVFERFFNDFGKSSKNFYELKKLNPAYRVIFNKENQIQIGDNIDSISSQFEKIEKGSGEKLKKFLKESKENYDLAVTNMLYKMPGKSIFELINSKTILKVNLFLSNIKKDIEKRFKDSKTKVCLTISSLIFRCKALQYPCIL